MVVELFRFSGKRPECGASDLLGVCLREMAAIGHTNELLEVLSYFICLLNHLVMADKVP